MSRVKYQSISDSFNEGLPIKVARKNVSKKTIVFHQKMVGSTIELSAKAFFFHCQVPIKIWVENPFLAIQHIENRMNLFY